MRDLIVSYRIEVAMISFDKLTRRCRSDNRITVTRIDVVKSWNRSLISHRRLAQLEQSIWAENGYPEDGEEKEPW
jgi:hypothetical protein